MKQPPTPALTFLQPTAYVIRFFQERNTLQKWRWLWHRTGHVNNFSWTLKRYPAIHNSRSHQGQRFLASGRPCLPRHNQYNDSIINLQGELIVNDAVRCRGDSASNAICFQEFGSIFIEDDHFLTTVAACTALPNALGLPIWGVFCDKLSFKVSSSFWCLLRRLGTMLYTVVKF